MLPANDVFADLIRLELYKRRPKASIDCINKSDNESQWKHVERWCWLSAEPTANAKISSHLCRDGGCMQTLLYLPGADSGVDCRLANASAVPPSLPILPRFCRLVLACRHQQYTCFHGDLHNTAPSLSSLAASPVTSPA